MPAPRSRYSEHTMKVLGRSDDWIWPSCSRMPGPRAGACHIRSPFAQIARTSKPGMPLDERFGMLKELMRAVDLVTSAEREHVMSKMLIILRREALGLDSPIGAADL